MSSLIIDPSNQAAARKSIALQTRKCTNIENSQILEIVEEEYAELMQNYRQKYLGIIVRPNTISGFYNCHGMTFASRRTGIDNLEWNMIKEDNYERVDNMAILAGDTVLYLSNNGEIEHSGIILWVPDNRLLASTMVLSKWGSGSEVIHGMYSCPYTISDIRFYRCEK